MANHEENYKRYLSLTLESIHEQGPSVENNSHEAIRFAADFSLALAARGMQWSNALGSELVNSSQAPRGRSWDNLKRIFVPESSSSSSSSSNQNEEQEHSGESSSSRMVRDDKLRLEALRGCIPGGDKMKSRSQLLEETIDYVSFLELEINVLEELVQSSANEIICINRKSRNYA